MQPSVVCPLLIVFSLTFEGDLRLRSQSCGTRDAGWFARSHVLDACRTVEVERAGRGCDEDRQETLDQVMEEEELRVAKCICNLISFRTHMRISLPSSYLISVKFHMML